MRIKTRKIKIISLILALVMILESLPVAAVAGEVEELALETGASGSGIYSVLILDTSSSMSGTPLDVQKQAAIRFCESVLDADGENYVAIVSLNSSPEMVCGFSSDMTTLESSINSLTAGGNTNTGYALTIAGNLLAEISETATKNIILCSDGLPVCGITSSTGPYNSIEYSCYKYANFVYNLAQTLKESYTIYTLGFFHSLSGSRLTFGEKLMEDIATDGCYYEVTDVDELEFEFGNISSDITYTPFETSGTFYYQSTVTNQKESYSFYYTDEWFGNSPYTTYQHELTQMSIRVAMAAFAPDSNPKNSTNAVNLLLQMGFSEIVSSYPEPEYDTIGYSIGSKTITTSSGETSTLIVVAVRGGGYGEEWGGNFRVLPDDEALFTSDADHEGFAIAASQVLSGISEYASSHTLESDVKIWICGFSRAAATSNLVGAELIDSVTGNSSESYVDGLTADGIYTFCFECPQDTLDSEAGDSRYSSIINVVNPVDIVPKVAPSELGYTRYGTTIFTPSIATTSDYQTYSESMIESYRSILSWTNSTTDVSILTSQTSSQSAVLDDIISSISDSLMLGSSGADWRESYLAIQDEIIAFAAETIEGEVGDAASVAEILLSLNSAFPSLASNVISLYASGGNLDSFGYAHYPELCLAWLDSDACESYFASQTGKTSETTVTASQASTYRKVYINGSVDVSAYDSGGNLVASIISGSVQDVKNGVGAYIDSDGQKVLIFPTDMEYTLNLTATADGNFTYTVTEYNFDSGKTEKVVGYHEVEAQAGDSFVGMVENLKTTADAQYPLLKSGTEELNATASLSGSEVTNYAVEVVAGDGGTVSGGGIYVSGEFARVTAIPELGYLFSGWYVGGELVSTDYEYRFLVDSDITVTAVFNGIGNSITSMITNWFANLAQLYGA